MRVEINIDQPARGLVSKYANVEDKTMPQAYGELLLIGLVASDVSSPAFSPDVDMDDDIMEISKRDSDEYSIEFHD